MHIYIFGSICRGEVDRSSDVDLLAVTDKFDDNLDAFLFSIYSYGRLREIWADGNPFAWHLFLESKLVYASDNVNYLASLGSPSTYTRCYEDCRRFYSLFRDSRNSLCSGSASLIFDLSTVFLSIRNFASCYSLGFKSVPDFSRESALRLGADSVPVDRDIFIIFERARMLSTRGIGFKIDNHDAELAFGSLGAIESWMEILLKRIEGHE